MSLEEFLRRQQDLGNWNSFGKFTLDRVRALAKPKAFSSTRRGQWALKVVQHAVETRAQELQVWDEGESLDESVGLSFRYDSVAPNPETLESELTAFLENNPPLSVSYLSGALLGLLESNRLGPLLRKPNLATFFANAGGRVCKLDLVNGKLEWTRTEARGWTYFLTVDRDRPLFTYSLFGHKEIAEILRGCIYCPIRISINGFPMMETAQGFLRSSMLLHLDVNKLKPEISGIGSPIWQVRNSRDTIPSMQVAIPRCPTPDDSVLECEGGRVETHFYRPPQRTTGSSIIPVVDGVALKPVPLNSRLRLAGFQKNIPFTAIVACPNLQVDHSHTGIVKDERWRQIVNTVEEQASYFSIGLEQWIERKKCAEQTSL
jgi:hypothetical protein